MKRKTKKRVNAEHGEENVQVKPHAYVHRNCSCNFIKTQTWHPDKWSTLVEQRQQQRIQGYETIYLHLPSQPRCQIPCIHNSRALDLYQHDFHDAHALFPYFYVK